MNMNATFSLLTVLVLLVVVVVLNKGMRLSQA